MICPVCNCRHNDRGEKTQERHNSNTKVLCNSTDCEIEFDNYTKYREELSEYGRLLHSLERI
jgi:hypothetical protein